MKQTAVEWLVEQIMKHDKSFLEFYGAEIEQAKEMEREQKIAFGKKCYHPLSERKHTSDVHFECTICGGNNY
jgi:hypothetical protein